jgi:hypothetical protein
MKMVIYIRPDTLEELARRAALDGVDIGSYAVRILHEAIRHDAQSKTLSPSQLEDMLQEIAQFSHKIPALPDEAFSRASLYRDEE